MADGIVLRSVGWFCLKADADQDGKIYYHEFVRWICQANPVGLIDLRPGIYSVNID